MDRVPANAGRTTPIPGMTLAPILSSIQVSFARDRALLFTLQPTALGLGSADLRARWARTKAVPPANAGVDAEAPTAMGTLAMIALFRVHRRNAGNQIAWADKVELFSRRIMCVPRFRRPQRRETFLVCCVLREVGA